MYVKLEPLNGDRQTTYLDGWIICYEQQLTGAVLRRVKSQQQGTIQSPKHSFQQYRNNAAVRARHGLWLSWPPAPS